MASEAVTLACSIAPPPPQYYDPRMTTAADAKGEPHHSPTAVALPSRMMEKFVTTARF